MSLAKVEISGLFGRFDHEISIDPKDKLAIIIAPNGFGKTVSLKLIRAALRLQVAYLQRINFQSIKLHFNDGVVYSITRRKSSASETRKPPQLSVRLVSPNGHDHKHDLVSDEEGRHGVSLDALLDHFVTDLQRRGPAEWLDTRTARVLTLTEAIDEYWELIPSQYMRSRKPGWLTDFTKQFEPRLIEAQRLVLVEGRRIEAHGRVSTTESDTTHVVSVQARTLAEKISAAVRQYAARAQQLDQTFPARALQRARSDQHPDQKEIYAALRDLGSRRQELIAVGLIDSVHEVLEVKEEAIEPSLLKFLDVYVSDVREKYAVFDQTYLRLQLLLRVLNDKFVFKQIEASQKSGLIVRSDEGHSISLTDLSSGEQNEIVLAYNLIFDSTDRTIILIDEPEISLHVAWQKQFLDDLKQVLSINRCTAIVATHSPQIIGADWNLTNDLGGSVGE